MSAYIEIESPYSKQSRLIDNSYKKFNKQHIQANVDVRNCLEKERNDKEDEKDLLIKKLMKELVVMKDRCAYSEGKIDDQNGLIMDLRRMIRRVAEEENYHYELVQKQKFELEKSVKSTQAALKSLEENGKDFDQVASYWGEFCEQKPEKKSHMEKMADYWKQNCDTVDIKKTHFQKIGDYWAMFCQD